MNKTLLENAISEIKQSMHHAVTTASYNGRVRETGLVAKDALIKSGSLIQRIHEVTKQSLHGELLRRGIRHETHPPIGKKTPELDIWGFLKKKKQDIVIVLGGEKPVPEKIDEGPLTGQTDEIGRQATQNSIVIGVRSQLSSVDKNFDTLMERTFAETFNLRLRHPRLVMGEVYMLAVKDYDEQLMKENLVGWKNSFTDVERFVAIFNSLNQRDDVENIRDFYKYERCLLLLVDFSADPPKVYETSDQLREDGVVNEDFSTDFSQLSPVNFSRDLVDAYLRLHNEV